MITHLWGSLDHCWTVPPVKKPFLILDLFHLNSCPAEVMIQDSLPIWSTPQDLSFPDESISPSFLSAAPLHLKEFSLCTMGTQRVLTCHLHGWWIALGHPYSNEELGFIRYRMALRYGQKNPSYLEIWRMPTKLTLSLCIKSRKSLAAPFLKVLLLKERSPGRGSRHSTWYICAEWIYKWNHKSNSFSH